MVPVVVEWVAMGTTGRSLATIAASLAVGAAVTVAASVGGLRVGAVPVFAACSLAALAINWVVYLPSYLARTERFYDLTGTLTYLCVVALALGFGNGDPRSILLGVLIAVWAVRLGSFLFSRIRRDGSDGRFDAIKVDPVRFAMSWTMQALWVVLTAGAALAAMTTGREVDPGWFVAPGVIVWALGFGIEVVADAQKRAFRADPANRGRFITTGLWAWSRHPNYFGEITLWVGIALIALPSLSGWQYVTLISPVFVAVLLTQISGVPLLEARAKHRWGDDPDYRDYRRRTPVLVLRPPSH